MFEVEVCIQNRIGREVVDVLETHGWWCEVGAVPLGLELRRHLQDVVLLLEVVKRSHRKSW